MTIADASEADLPAVRMLLHEYAAWVALDLEFQGFSRELRNLPGDYAPPDGALLLARLSEDPVGMVALRRMDATRAEMKRLYVRPAARQSGLGRRLAERIIDEARHRGYRQVLLDTLPVMARAQRLYLSLGFRETAPYYPSPIPGTTYMVLDLDAGDRR
ncbi:MAG: GNAT family N-acetyltransferase [Acidobacteriota bacterium]